MTRIRGSLVEIGLILRERRRHLDLTQTEVARRAATTRSTVHRIEAGQLNPTWMLVVAISQALDLQPVLVPRSRLRAVEVIMRDQETDGTPPLAGSHW
jgi:predicted transcriptional regulator